MARSKVSQDTSPSKSRAQAPVSADIHRAAERAGVAPSETASELESLRGVAHSALSVFEARGLMWSDRDYAEVFHEVLLCARSDFQTICDACEGGAGCVDSMVFRRAELRIDFGLALAKHCQRFGIPRARSSEQDTEIGGAS